MKAKIICAVFLAGGALAWVAIAEDSSGNSVSFKDIELVEEKIMSDAANGISHREGRGWHGREGRGGGWGGERGRGWHGREGRGGGWGGERGRGWHGREGRGGGWGGERGGWHHR